MYCPICGDEYVEGVTRCSEHDVALVEDPPAFDDPPPSWLDRATHELLLRIRFIVLVLAGAALGAVVATYAWDHWIPHAVCADPPFPGRYQWLNCIGVPPPLWLKGTMMVAGTLLVLSLHALFRRWASRRSGTGVTWTESLTRAD